MRRRLGADAAAPAVHGAAAGANPADNTDVFLDYSDDGGATWNPAQVDPGTGLQLPANDDDETVRDILKRKKGSIRRATLGSGSPSWDDIMDET